MTTPSFDDAWRLHEAGELRRAEEIYRRLLQREPRNGRVWYVLGHLCEADERPAEAAACFRQALEIEPCEAEGYFHLGNLLLKQRQWAEALPSYRRCLELKPGHLEALVNLGFVLGEQAMHAEAEACYQKALSLKADVAEVHHNLGNSLREQGKTHESLACYQEALRLRPDYAKAHINLGVALLSLGRVDEAVARLRRGVELEPDFAEAHSSLGAALSAQGKLDEALALYERAIEIKPDYAEAHWNRALCWLLAGDFERGWPEYEWRWKCEKTGPAPALGKPAWDGTPLDGKTILLYAEQGLGDTLQFVRYAPLVHALGGRVVLRCQRSLVPILAGLSDVERLIADDDPLPQFDLHAALMSLPGILGTTLETVPADVPYLAADPERVSHWRQVLDTVPGFHGGPGFRVGIVWQGSTRHPWDRHRSCQLSHFECLSRVDGTRLICLQKGPGVEQLLELGGNSDLIVAYPGGVDESGAFLDTAAIMANVDLVITVDTAAAHLAGALGVPVWLALHFTPDYRWLLERDDSPWYPTMRLFRQAAVGDWDGVFSRIAIELAAEVEGLTGSK